jgi:cytochrome P450
VTDATRGGPPEPHGRPIVGHLPAIWSDPLAFLAGAVRDQGDVVGYHGLGRKAVLLGRPDLVDGMLTAPIDTFLKGRAIRALEPVIGGGLVLAEGRDWARQRGLVRPAFAPERLAAYGRLMGARALSDVQGWGRGGTREVLADLERLTLSIAALTLVGIDLEDDGRVGELLHLFLERFGAVARTGMSVPLSVPTRGNLRLRHATRRLDATVDALAAERRALGVRVEDDERAGGSPDLLGLLLASRDEAGRPLGDAEIRDQVKTFLIAGHATIDVALAWAIHLLATDEAAQDRLAAEAAAIGSRALEAGDLPRLRFAGQVLHETLRLYPPVWSLSRVAASPWVADRFAVSEGTSVVASQWVTHRDRRWWEDAAAFRPDRWAARDGGAPRGAFFAFGGGQRKCVGQAFALMEGVLVLATIARRFRWRPAHGRTIVPWATLTLQPRGGVQVTFSLRETAEVVLG